jgi:alkylated DNA nucleotide flippase Atl1
MAAVTPSGCRSVYASTLVETLGVFRPARCTGSPQANSTVSRPRITSARASGNVLPWSRVMRAASSSRWAKSSSRNRKKTWLRAMSGVSRQAGKAAWAAATALATSSEPPRGTRAMTWPVAGL